MPERTRSHRLHDIEVEVRARNAALARELWRMGHSLREVQRDELWREGGHRGFDDRLAVAKVTRSSHGCPPWPGAPPKTANA